MADLASVISLDNVTLAHGARRLLDGANLALSAGSFTVLAGANGHGKTTLLRALLGLHPVVGGKIKILGYPPSAARHRVGYMPQDRRLPAPQMTGRSLVAASWRGTRFGLPGWSPGLDNAMATALSRTGAETLATQPLNQLSGGERQRLFLAEALLESPPLLILDEPLSSMDSGWQHKILKMLHERCRAEGMTVLMSCHGEEGLKSFPYHRLRISRQKLELCVVAL